MNKVATCTYIRTFLFPQNTEKFQEPKTELSVEEFVSKITLNFRRNCRTIIRKTHLHVIDNLLEQTAERGAIAFQT